MKIKDRLQELHDEDYTVKHKLLGKVVMFEGYDLIRVRQIGKGKTVKDYCEFLYAECLSKANIYQSIDDKLLNREIVCEEVWMVGSDCSLDMFVNED